jgi:hypothetical protein
VQVHPTMERGTHVEVVAATTTPKGGKKNTRDITWEDVDPKKFVAYGSVFSIMFDSALYPADVVKTRLQVQGGAVCKLALCYLISQSSHTSNQSSSCQGRHKPPKI